MIDVFVWCVGFSRKCLVGVFVVGVLLGCYSRRGL